MDKFVIRTPRLPSNSKSKSVDLNKNKSTKFNISNNPNGNRHHESGFLGSRSDISNIAKRAADLRRNQPLYVSISTGHQVKEVGYSSMRSYMVKRSTKLKQQAPPMTSGIFQGTRMYINGFTGPLSDSELRDMIQRNGGEISMHLALKSCTHMIATSLAGKKKDDFLNGGKGANLKIVRPQWVMDSVAKGRRLNEGGYLLMKKESEPILNF